GLRTGARMLLGDIRVRDSNLSEGMVREFGTTLRRRGIGTGLLRRFLEEADAAGVAQVWGSVTAVDLGRNPELLGWYTRRGFEVTAPDGKCDPDASHMIIRNRP
ncbi:MAG TPA: GNAT family N-acetyltransferase, partial [Tepidisphaeraceae bacterium]|nr:GNAT family N-acetyltransferase [Tepidisphaeraceae bacterium]